MKKHIAMAALHVLLGLIGCGLVGLGFRELFEDDLFGLVDVALGVWFVFSNCRWLVQEIRAIVSARKGGRS